MKWNGKQLTGFKGRSDSFQFMYLKYYSVVQKIGCGGETRINVGEDNKKAIAIVHVKNDDRLTGLEQGQ